MRWADAAERSTVDGPMPDGSASKAGWMAMMRAVIARGSIEQMQADAVASMEGISQTGAWWPVALLVRAYSHLLVGETDRADEVFAEALAASNAVGAFTTSQLAAAERSLIAIDAGDVPRPRRSPRGRERGPSLAAGRVQHDGDGLRGIGRGSRSGRATWHWRAGTLPTPRGCGRCSRTLCRGFPYTPASSSPGRGCSLATPPGSAASSSRSTVSGGAGRTSGSWSTRRRRCGGRSGRCRPTRQVHLRSPPPNCRLLPLLPTHLSFREIGERLFVSTNTVKTQAISIYRKLGASSRSEAVRRASEVGLLDPATTLRHFSD